MEMYRVLFVDNEESTPPLAYAIDADPESGINQGIVQADSPYNAIEVANAEAGEEVAGGEQYVVIRLKTGTTWVITL